MSLLDPDSDVGNRFTRDRVAQDIFVRVMASSTVGLHRAEAVAKEAFKAADVFVQVKTDNKCPEKS